MLALLESIEEKDQGNFIANSIIDSDERFISTEKEREKVFKTFLDENGKANQIPKKENIAKKKSMRLFRGCSKIMLRLDDIS